MPDELGTAPHRPDGIGASVRRREDLRFLTGTGVYTDDLNRAGQLYAYILRSPHAHARILSYRLDAARSMPGVEAIYTGEDVARDGLGGLPCGWGIVDKFGKPMAEPGHPVLAIGKVRHVGDPVALIIARTKMAARDAAEAIEIDFEELEAIPRAATALAEGAALVHDEIGHNLCYDWEIGDAGAVAAAFDRAAHVVRLDLVNNRLVANPMEPRAALGEFDPGTGNYTLSTTSQNPHVIRLLMGTYVLNIPEHKLRVVAPDVGGGFGCKIYHYAEEALVTWAAGKLKRPVKWTADRSEAFMSDAQGRDHESVAELALDPDGHFLALRVETIANLGAYLSTFAPAIPTILYATLLAGPYKTPAIHCRVRAAFTHTIPVDAYRGAGRPEATYLLERIVDQAARQIKMDPAELRRRNFIASDAFPYQTPVALQYDSGDFHATLEMALKSADYAGFADRRAASEAKGKRRGIGLSSYIEACGLAPSRVAGALGARAGLYECAEIRVNPTGSITVFTGAHSHGQGHETTFAQLVASGLGVPADSVEIVHGDTNRIPFGMGTYGSRSLSVGGSAIMRAMDKVVAKGRKIAAHLLEASEADIEFRNGQFSVTGTDRGLPFAQVALAAYVPHNYPLETLEPGLDETAFYDPTNFTYPGGTHVCEVEVDPETGVVTIERFTAADDFGRIINPMIVDGQVHGGIAQGIGQALLEGAVYDPDSGQLLTGSFMDYGMPRADMLPNFHVENHVTLCTHNPLGVKGCGEAGAIGSPPAVINAILDALAADGVTRLDMPATPDRVWRALHRA